MPRVLVLSPSDSALSRCLQSEALPDFDPVFSAPEGVSPAQLVEVEILLGSPAAIAPLLRHCSNLRWVQSTWAGVRPLLEAASSNYQLTALKGVFGQAMSEYVLGWVLALERRIIERANDRAWNNAGDRSVAGRRMGIMGTGSIGGEVAAAAAALGIEVVGLNSDGRDVAGFTRCYPVAERLAFANGLDYLVGLLPETPDTDGLVDAGLLAALADDALFINGGRGNCVVERDLLAALQRRNLQAAVLDVLPIEPLPESSPLWQVEHLYITSHTAAPTAETAAAAVFCDNYRRFVAGKPLKYLVDFARGY
jgi:phosphoglycerate dehydrogenase-like enzyme